MDQSSFVYKSVGTSGQSMYRASGSKHYGQTFHVKSEGEIKQILDKLWSEHPDATHICYAWKLGLGKDKYRMNDDGEPSGTAGKPIYGQILSHGLTNVLITVIRYYGGVKLGTSGLIDAYKTAAQQAIQQSEIVDKELVIRVRFAFGYAQMAVAMEALKRMEFEKIEMESDSLVTMCCNVPKKYEDRLRQLLDQIGGKLLEKSEV